ILAAFWENDLILTLFFLGMFISRPAFRAHRDQQLYERHLSSHTWFFPGLVSLYSVIPLGIFATDGVSLHDLLTTAALLPTFCLSLYLLASQVADRLPARITRPVVYYAIFTFALGAPLAYDWKNMLSPSPLTYASLYFLGPYKAIHSVWLPADHGFFQDGPAVWQVALGTWLVFLGVGLVMALLRPRRAS
ncbi:MAG: hypothetical protein ACYCW6_13245, partial [Candidatus Xenobia bacterium]